MRQAEDKVVLWWFLYHSTAAHISIDMCLPASVGLRLLFFKDICVDSES